MKFNVPEMSCGHCRASIGKAIADLDQSATVTFDMETRQIDVTTAKPAADVVAALDDAGFDAVAA